jgi:hypothetical protein
MLSEQGTKHPEAEGPKSDNRITFRYDPATGNVDCYLRKSPLNITFMKDQLPAYRGDYYDQADIDRFVARL